MINTNTIQKSDDIRRSELSDFLKSRRKLLNPVDFGIPIINKRRVCGLRREEVAQLAGVSVSWYTWLEQGRAISVSEQVLDSIGRVLRLTKAEHRHLYLLAKECYPLEQGTVLESEQISAELQSVLDAFIDCPAYITNKCWNIIGWNHAAETIFSDYLPILYKNNNLIWLLFSPQAQNIFPDWEMEAKRCLAVFRCDAELYIGEPWLTILIEELSAINPYFNEWWGQYNLEIPSSKRKRMNHSSMGELVFNTVVLSVAEQTDLKITVYIPYIEV